MRAAALLVSVLAVLLTAGPAYAGDDQVVITGDVVVERGQTLDDIFVINGHVIVRGRVTGDIITVSAPIRINGPVGGDVVAVSDRVTIGPGGRIDGDLLYGDEDPVVTVPGAVRGDTESFDYGDLSTPLGSLIARLALWLAMSVSTLLLGLALLWLAPAALEAAREIARTRTGAAIGIGLAAFFGLPAVAVVLFITLVGIPLSVALLLALIPIYAVAYATSAFLLGRAVVRPPRGRFLAFLAGWAILRAIALIPWVGGLAWFAATVFGLGALAIALWRSRRGAVAGTSQAPLAA